MTLAELNAVGRTCYGEDIPADIPGVFKGPDRRWPDVGLDGCGCPSLGGYKRGRRIKRSIGPGVGGLGAEIVPSFGPNTQGRIVAELQAGTSVPDIAKAEGISPEAVEYYARQNALYPVATYDQKVGWLNAIKELEAAKAAGGEQAAIFEAAGDLLRAIGGYSPWDYERAWLGTDIPETYLYNQRLAALRITAAAELTPEEAEAAAEAGGAGTAYLIEDVQEHEALVENAEWTGEDAAAASEMSPLERDLAREGGIIAEAAEETVKDVAKVATMGVGLYAIGALVLGAGALYLATRK